MKKILIISDGKPGHLNQSIAFAKIKEVDYDILRVDFKKKVFKAFSYFFDKFGFYSDFFFENYEKLDFTVYDAVVSTGSGTYYFNKFIAKKYNKKSIALMLPRSYRYDNFYFILAQKHDRPPMLSNIITIPLNLSYPNILGILEKNSDKKSVGIIIGGNNDVFSMDRLLIEEKLDYIFENYKDYEKYITTSRRTPEDIEELIEKYDFDYKLIYSQNPSINPIGDFINICDEFFITIDSTSMLSEVRANSDAKINIVELYPKKEDTKYHKLAKIVDNIKQRVDFRKLLQKVEI